MTTTRPTRAELLDKIRSALRRIGLPEMARQLERELESGPDDHDSRLDFLWRLLEPQLRARLERSLQYRIGRARFPAPKSLDQFDFDFQPSLSRERVMELATLDFVRQGQNVLIGGMSGTGKSHLAIALGYLACTAGIRTLYTTSADMLGKLSLALATGRLPEALKPYTRVPLLIIDDVGLDKPERDTAADAHLFYKVIAPRYESQRSTAITSNIPWDAWGDHLGDDVAAVAVIDRLIHHGHLLTIDGPSYRAAEHNKLNKPTTPVDAEPRVGD